MKLSELYEGTWSIPDTVQKAKKLIDLLSNPLPLSKAQGKLYNILGDDQLFDSLGSELRLMKREKSPDVDVSELIKTHLDRMLTAGWNSADPAAIKLLKDFVK